MGTRGMKDIVSLVTERDPLHTAHSTRPKWPNFHMDTYEFILADRWIPFHIGEYERRGQKRAQRPTVHVSYGHIWKNTGKIKGRWRSYGHIWNKCRKSQGSMTFIWTHMDKRDIWSGFQQGHRESVIHFSQKESQIRLNLRCAGKANWSGEQTLVLSKKWESNIDPCVSAFLWFAKSEHPFVIGFRAWREKRRQAWRREERGAWQPPSCATSLLPTVVFLFFVWAFQFVLIVLLHRWHVTVTQADSREDKSLAANFITVFIVLFSLTSRPPVFCTQRRKGETPQGFSAAASRTRTSQKRNKWGSSRRWNKPTWIRRARPWLTRAPDTGEGGVPFPASHPCVFHMNSYDNDSSHMFSYERRRPPCAKPLFIVNSYEKYVS